MKLAGEYVFDAPRDSVWRALLDPVVLASVLPGCEKLELVGENEYEGILKIKVGPVQGDFKGKVKLEDLQAPSSYTMQVDGRGGPGFVKATANVRLEDRGAQTAMSYDSDAQVGGRIASVGQRLLDSSAKAIIKQSLQGLDGVISTASATARATGVGEAEAQAAAVQAAPKPTQNQLAASVAKEVAKELAPTGGKWILVAVVVALALLALYFLLP
jgi:hypothetical protein